MDKLTELNFERRKSPRAELKGLTGRPSRPGVAKIIDISAGGAQVQFAERLVPGNIYEMRLTFPDRRIVARVLVTRSEDLAGVPGEGGGTTVGCRAGIEFLGLEPGEAEYLESFVAGLCADRG